MHRAQSVTVLWIAYRIGVVKQCCQMVQYNTIFHKNGVILHACAWASELGRYFSRGGTSAFFQKFFCGAKSGETCFLPLEIKKTAFLAELFNPAPLPTPKGLCVGKVYATPLKNLGNFKCFNTKLLSFTGSCTQHEIFDRSISTVFLFLHWQR